MAYYYLEKEFQDYTEDIEAVFIHYACALHGDSADWEQHRVVYMPRARSTPLHGHVNGQLESNFPSGELSPASLAPLRKKVLKLPQRLWDLSTREVSDQYILHYYFEIVQDGSRHYSSLYTEEIVTTKKIEERRFQSVNERLSAVATAA